MSEIVKYNNDFNLLPMPELKAIQMDMFMAIISLTKDKKENTPFLKKFFNPDKRKIIIPQKKFIELCRLNDSKMDYKEIFFAIDDCLKKLCNFLISYQKDERTIYNFVCFEEANIIADEVHITLQSRFYDMIINKKFGFTAFELAEFAELSGKYTKTLYRLLKQFRTTGKAYFEWEEFCRIMKIPENYRQIDIDQRILKPAIKELSKERNLFDQIRVPFKNLAYEKEKTAGRGRGGKVSGISFTFKPENIEMQKLENESQKIMSDEQKYLKILNNMKLNQARFNYNDKLWQFNDFDFDEFKIIAIELVRDEYENLNFGNHMHFNAKNQEQFFKMIDTFRNGIR
ncbi:RepB family plasmid replication initiator protein, partial [Campylobacter coli]|uniref:replication initiation protein n=1 Tax=Campylobacter coli TaxID=195 RepID=UPI00093080DB|nr:replication initiation protein [Campylobacter coli]EAH8225228.1 RepB family plasmid replication initiator protein [Campylobacter coli]EAI1381116.1 RepB family plasmid replication initiator protein [Campylobacter coli]EAI8086949.1 RepB family plasmid replication initiator protein [Campylobacter coli]EAI8097701.1 RepB family plasmid replication initiator protein [Campylobacter coli]EAI8102875.1 RepB family plasmid replication initiator protein [Campylobacter coli]